MTTAVATFGERHFGAADLGHTRRNRCLVRIADRLYRHPGGTLPAKLQAPKDYKAMIRLVNRPEVTHAAVLAPHRQRTLERMRQATGVLLVLHDTTELDYSGLHAIADLGSLGNGGGRGLLCHNSLAFDPQRHEVLGLAQQVLHRRRLVGRGEAVPTKRARADRESRLWLEGLAGVGLPPAGARWVHVADRGADTFEFLARHQAEGHECLVRSRNERAVDLGHDGRGPRDYLHVYARTQPLQGRRSLAVAARPGQPARTATVGVAWAPVLLQPPHVRRGDYAKLPLRYWVIRVAELDPPAGGRPLEWLLLTNRPVADVADAWQRVDWYACRWVIEEYHKAQKTGCGIEDVQFTSAQALEPMLALLSVVAVALLNLREASRLPDAATRPATELIDGRYVAVLSGWRHRQVRPDWSVHDFFHALARLGGHQNRKGDRRPGWLVLWRGWMALQHMLDGAEAVGFKSCG